MRQIKHRSPHALWLRLAHWTLAISTLGLISSGFAIFNAAPFYDISFPTVIALGTDLTGALRWHFLFIWTFAGSLSLLILGRLIKTRSAPPLIPIRASKVRVEIVDTFRLKLAHQPGVYIHTQRLLYLGCFALLALALLSGLVLWKPVQLQALASVVGGYELARRIHFWSMTGLGAFIAVHLTMVLVAPSTLLGMLFGARVPRSEKSSEKS
ncbi:MAG: cytochrome b/b6 domain-containing protein [Pseudomonadota bacterium]